MITPYSIECRIDTLCVISTSRKKFRYEDTKISGCKSIGRNCFDDKVFSYNYLTQKNKSFVRIFPPSEDGIGIPTLTVKFYSSWLKPLSYDEVISVLNELSRSYNLFWKVSEFHLAIDLIYRSGDGDFYWIKDHLKARKSVTAEACQKYPDTYHFHSMESDFRLTTYDKAEQLLRKEEEQKQRSKSWRREILGKEGEKFLKEFDVFRIEPRFNNTRLEIVSSLEELAKLDFSFVHPGYLAIKVPDYKKLARRGFLRGELDEMSLSEIKGYFKEHGPKNNFWYYMKDEPILTKAITEALSSFRWCSHPEEYPLHQPGFLMRSTNIKFITHKEWWK